MKKPKIIIRFVTSFFVQYEFYGPSKSPLPIGSTFVYLTDKFLYKLRLDKDGKVYLVNRHNDTTLFELDSLASKKLKLEYMASPYIIH